MNWFEISLKKHSAHEWKTGKQVERQIRKKIGDPHNFSKN